MSAARNQQRRIITTSSPADPVMHVRGTTRATVQLELTHVPIPGQYPCTGTPPCPITALGPCLTHGVPLGLAPQRSHGSWLLLVPSVRSNQHSWADRAAMQKDTPVIPKRIGHICPSVRSSINAEPHASQLPSAQPYEQ